MRGKTSQQVTYLTIMITSFFKYLHFQQCIETYEIKTNFRDKK